MPKADFSLATQSLNVGSPTRGSLSAMQVNSQGQGLQANMVDPSSGFVNNTPLPVPRVVLDTKATALANMANSWAEAAFQFKERENQAKADELVMNTQNSLTVLLEGGEKEGETTKGYTQNLGKAGVEAYSGFRNEVDQVVTGALDGQPEGVKAKALLRIQSLKNGTINAGAQHKAKENLVWQDNVQRAYEDQVVRKLSENQPSEVQQGMVNAFAQIDSRFIGQPELASVKKQEMIDRVGQQAVERSIALGDYDRAYEWLAWFGGEIPEKAGAASSSPGSPVSYSSASGEGDTVWPAPIDHVEAGDRVVRVDSSSSVEVPSSLFATARPKPADPNMEEIELNPTTSAKLFAMIESAEASALKTQLSREEDQDKYAKAAAEKEMWDVVNIAVSAYNHGTPEEMAKSKLILEQIIDPELRSKAATAYDKLTQMTVSVPGTKEALLTNIDKVSSGQIDIYAEPYMSQLNGTDRAVIQDAATTFREAEMEAGHNDVNSFVDSLMSSALEDPSISFNGGRSVAKSKVDVVRDKLRTDFYARVDYHLKKKKDAVSSGSEAMNLALNDIMRSGKLELYKADLAVTPASLPSLGAWSTEPTKFERAARSLKDDGSSELDTPGLIEVYKVETVDMINNHYGVPMDLRGKNKTNQDIVAFLLATDQDISEYMNDLITVDNQIQLVKLLKADQQNNTPPSNVNSVIPQE